MTIDLTFMSNEADEEEGLGNAGIETYRDRPYASTAREVAQNSRDAAVALPVRISFDLLEIQESAIPALKTLRKANGHCLKKARDANDSKEIAHFEQAGRVLAGERLKILRISDFNTLGLRGPAKKGTPFHSLIKGSGVSVKESDASGGSFGIGKNAVFAISDIQTVLYSTIWEDQETKQKHFLAQGKAVLVSHTDDEGINHRAAAYWGMPNFKPIEDIELAPEWLRRQEIGTSVFALGFRETAHWQYRIAYSLLENFFYAVHSEEMEFAIDGGNIVINRANLSSLFESEEIRAAAEQDDREQEFDLARQMYQCLISPEATEATVSVPGLGNVYIRVLVAEGLPKKIFIIRNGMVITDSLENFGDKFVRFSMCKEFSCIVVPVDQDGRALIKRLENPRHDGLSAERLSDERDRNNARKIMKQFATVIRDTVKSCTMTGFDKRMAVDEMRDYFSVAAEASDKKQNSEQDDPNTIRYKVQPRRPQTETSATARGTGTGGGPKPGPRPGPKPGPVGPDPKPHPFGRGASGNARTIKLSDFRNIVPPGASPSKRTIFFTPEEGGLAKITLDASGMNESEELVIQDAPGSILKGGEIRRNLVAGARTKIEVEFRDPYSGPIELSVSLVPEEGGANEAQ